MQTTLTFAEVLWFIGGISALITFYKLLTTPYKELDDKLTKQQKTITDLSSEIKIQQSLLNSSLKVQLLLMQHVIYGNHTEAIKSELAKFQEAIVDTK
jgi:hypothetical protein